MKTWFINSVKIVSDVIYWYNLADFRTMYIKAQNSFNAGFVLSCIV